MPIFKEIPADAPVVEVSEETLRADVDAARADVERYAALQADARANKPRAEFAQIKQDTDGLFMEAIAALAAAEKALGRFLGSGAGQRIAVAPATESANA